MRFFFSFFCNFLCLEMNSWQWCGRDFLKCWDCVKGREVKWGEENSWLLFLSWFRNYWPLLSIFFFMYPNSELTGKLLSAFLNVPNVYNFLCKEPGLKNKNRRVLKEEGSGRRLKWGPEGHRWEMGGDWGGLGWGDGQHTWFLLLTAMRSVLFLYKLVCNFIAKINNKCIHVWVPG